MTEKKELTAEQKEILDTLNKPVCEQTANSDKLHVGIFYLDNGSIEHVNPKATVAGWRKSTILEPRSIVATEISEIDKEVDEKYNSAVAYVEQDKDAPKIILPAYKLTDAARENMNTAERQFDSYTQYLLHNPVAEIDILAHERTHYHHALIHSGTNDTPYMASQSSDLTEQIANFNEYMTIAHVWKNAKQAGLENIILNNQMIATDDILNYSPNLKEEVLKNGFDENDPACRERIAQIASNYWNNDRSQAYKAQADNDAQYASDSNFSTIGAIVNAREWETRKKQMVENLMTGDGATYSAPECLKYFVPTEERTKGTIEYTDKNISNEALLEIDAYINQKGYTTDEDKKQFIETQIYNITHRSPDADQDFAQLLLSVSPANKQEITYADNITVKYRQDNVLIAQGTSMQFYAPISSLQSNQVNQDILHTEIKSQSGKYPPDAPTPEIAAQRTLAELQMSNACTMNEYRQEKAAQAQSEPQPEKATPAISNNLILANASKQSSR